MKYGDNEIFGCMIAKGQESTTRMSVWRQEWREDDVLCKVRGAFLQIELEY